MDHRELIGLPPARGADELRRRGRKWFEAVESTDQPVEEILDLRPEGLLVRRHEHGRDQAGGSFEGQFLALGLFDADGMQSRVEMFDADRKAEALARFAELRPDPLRIPPNAATRARDRSFEALVADDWAALRALTSEDFRFEDRGKRALVSGGVEPYIESLKFFRSQGGQFDAFNTIATAGDRLALDRTLVEGSECGGRVRDGAAHPQRGRCRRGGSGRWCASMPTIAAPPAWSFSHAMSAAATPCGYRLQQLKHSRAFNEDHDLERVPSHTARRLRL